MSEPAQGPQSYYGRWIAGRRKLQVKKFGARCWNCKNREYEDLHFAHLRGKETALSGMGGGRGSYARYTDVEEHPECYGLLCGDCHRDYDYGDERTVAMIQKQIDKWQIRLGLVVVA